MQRAALEVDVLPAQRIRLAGTNASEGEQGEQGTRPPWRCRKDGAQLDLVERAAVDRLAVRPALGAEPLQRIALDPFLLERVEQERLEGAHDAVEQVVALALLAKKCAITRAEPILRTDFPQLLVVQLVGACS